MFHQKCAAHADPSHFHGFLLALVIKIICRFVMLMIEINEMDYFSAEPTEEKKNRSKFMFLSFERYRHSPLVFCVANHCCAFGCPFLFFVQWFPQWNHKTSFLTTHNNVVYVTIWNIHPFGSWIVYEGFSMSLDDTVRWCSETAYFNVTNYQI